MAIKFLKMLLVFVFGALGGLWAQIYLLPYLAGLDYFQDFPFVKMLKDREMIVNPMTETTIIVQENMALQDAVERVKKVAVGVKSKTKEGEILQGSGLIVTSDGLLITLAELVPQGSEFFFYVDGNWPAFQILKRDLKNNLALIKIEQERLPTAGFADLQKKKLGERVFLVAVDLSTTTKKIMVNQGIITFFNNGLIQTNILQESNIDGSPIFDISGSLVGLSSVDEQGRVFAVPIDIIRQFIGL